MKKYKPVSVPKAAFVFCRLSLAALIWAALLLHSKQILLFVFIVFLLSAVLKVKRAPMVLLYSCTINRLIKSKDEVLNEHAMAFAHIMGSTFSFICLFLLYFVNEKAGWVAVFVFALLKSISAFGFCPAAKLYECSTNDSCCAFAKKYVR
ncbi:DUF4395 domain-containing protein [Candidatus Falkowbacteria bacterium]|nr:DUF4395 domain-containing protein [Candidatus Falkowbacteria bacterium]